MKKNQLYKTGFWVLVALFMFAFLIEYFSFFPTFLMAIIVMLVPAF